MQKRCHRFEEIKRVIFRAEISAAKWDRRKMLKFSYTHKWYSFMSEFTELSAKALLASIKLLLLKLALAEQFKPFSVNIWFFCWLWTTSHWQSSLLSEKSMNWLLFAFLWRCTLDVQDRHWRSSPKYPLTGLFELSASLLDSKAKSTHFNFILIISILDFINTKLHRLFSSTLRYKSKPSINTMEQFLQIFQVMSCADHAVHQFCFFLGCPVLSCRPGRS